MSNRGISAGSSLRQHVQTLWRGLHTRPCIRNRHQNWFQFQTPVSSFQFLASRDIKRWAHSTRGGSDTKDNDQGDKWRKDFMEKQAEVKKKFDNVKPPPAVKEEDWWTPDPWTGVYTPESCHGCVTTAPWLRRMSSPRPYPQRRRSSSDKKKNPKDPLWFDNMEELPDMDRRHSKK